MKKRTIALMSHLDDADDSNNSERQRQGPFSLSPLTFNQALAMLMTANGHKPPRNAKQPKKGVHFKALEQAMKKIPESE